MHFNLNIALTVNVNHNITLSINRNHTKIKMSSQNICELIVKDVLESVIEEASRAETPTKASPSCNIGEWVDDTSLGGGWKTCVINTDGAETRMFYSPCGRLFHSFQDVESYLEDVFCSYTNIKRKLSLAEDNGSLMSSVKPVDTSLATVYPENIPLDLVDEKFDEEEILLSDEEYQTPPEKKRKLCQEEVDHQTPLAESFPAVIEDLLCACHAEWPVTTGEIVTSILGEVNTMRLSGDGKTAVTREKIENWYAQRNRDLFITLFNAV